MKIKQLFKEGRDRAKFNLNPSFGVNNLKMDQKVYKLRKRVIDIIYDIKKRILPDLPRIDIRITTESDGIGGLAKISKNIIWIPRSTLDRDKAGKWLYRIVIHEIGHAVYGLRHDPKCPVMNLKYDSSLTRDDYDKALLKKIG